MCDHSLHSVKSQPALISNRCGSACAYPGAAFQATRHSQDLASTLPWRNARVRKYTLT